MKIHLICRDDQRDWILGKIAVNMSKELSQVVDVSLGDGPNRAADINHYVWYSDFRPGVGQATIGITHIDSVSKFELVRKQLQSALAGICMSREQMESLIHAGLPGKKLCYVTPAHDAVIASRQIHIGITTRLYTPDPCKREWLLLELAERIDPRDFTFTIMGSNWEPIVQTLQRQGFSVAYYPDFSLDRYRALIPTFEYYLYLGWDEGSMGLLDALHAGVKTIATSQGFHLDIENGLTHGFEDLNSLIGIFSSIAAKKHARVTAVRELTWTNYALKHVEIWRYLLSGHREAVRSSYRDGLNTLLSSLPPDSERGRKFILEIERIDAVRHELQMQYETALRCGDTAVPAPPNIGGPSATGGKTKLRCDE